MSERRLAVITGASSGIGATFARKLAARGWDLLLIARREDRLGSLAAEFAETHHIAAEPMIADLACDQDVERVAAKIRAAPNLGLLVNNAGFGSRGYFVETDLLVQDRMHRVHILATMHLTRAALSNLIPRRTGGVINVSSVAAFMQGAQSVSYCATKTWMNSFTEGLAIEMAALQSPVKMQALCPGFTLSEFHATLGMARSSISKSLWLTPDFVVEESLKGFERGVLFVIPSWRYKLVVAGMKRLPAWLLRWGARRFRKPRN